MKKMLLVLVAVIFLAAVSWGEGEAKQPFGAVSFELGGAIIAPIGVGVEFFLGRVGLGAELRFLFAAFSGVFGGFIEPGAAVRFYFAPIESSLFLMGGVSYVTGFAIGAGGAGTAPIGLLKPKLAVGYNVLFGKNGRIRFAAELGAVYIWPVVQGDLVDISNLFPILPHALIMFGYAF
jgi:hypothetical protein